LRRRPKKAKRAVLDLAGCRPSLRAPNFQADDEGSIPFTRSILKINDLDRISGADFSGQDRLG
jgi:hypothetical protein